MEITQKEFIPVMLTPFKENGEVDYIALTKLTELYIGAGAKALFANCLSSEMFELSDEERIKIISKVVAVSKGDVPVLATGSFGGSLEQQSDFVKKVYHTGADTVILITSLLAAESDSDEILNRNIFKMLDLTADIPLGFYECPVPYKRILSASQLGQFVATGRIRYHKDTSLNLDQIKAKLALTNGRRFGLYDAYMAHAVESLKAGSAGFACIQGNYFPELIVWLCDNYNNADCLTGVDLVQKFLVKNMDVMHHVYPVVSKYFLQKRGVEISLSTRRKVGRLTPKIIEQVDALFNEYTQIQQQLDIKLLI